MEQLQELHWPRGIEDRGKPHLKSKWEGLEVQGDPGPKEEGKKEGEKQVGAEGRMDSQSVQKEGRIAVDDQELTAPLFWGWK